MKADSSFTLPIMMPRRERAFSSIVSPMRMNPRYVKQLGITLGQFKSRRYDKMKGFAFQALGSKMKCKLN